MNKKILFLTGMLFLIFSQAGQTDPLNIPLKIDYQFIKKILVSQVYNNAAQTAELWNDRSGCSYLKLSNPRIDGKKGQIHLLNDVQAKFGTALNHQCITLLEWGGTLETFQKPTLEADSSILRFPVTQINTYDPQGKKLNIDKLEDLISKFAQPKLAGIKLDLNEARTAVARNLGDYLPAQNVASIEETLKSVKFNQVTAGDQQITLNLGFDNPAPQLTKKIEPILNAAEQQEWTTAWQNWQASLSKDIEDVAARSPELHAALTQTLQDAQSSLQTALVTQTPDNADPIRGLFSRSWERLAPLLKNLTNDVPGIQGLRYLTLVAGTDMVHELEKFLAPFGGELSQDGIRRLGRQLLAAKQAKAASQPAQP